MRRWYWWIVAKEDTGERYLIFGSDKSEEDARQKGFELGMSDFDIKRFPTREVNAASHMLKYGILSKTGNIRTATQRLRHEKSLRRKTGRTTTHTLASEGRGMYYGR